MLLLMMIKPDRVPLAVGLNATEISQLAFGSIVEPQVLVPGKSLGCEPATVIVEIASVPRPVFFTVTFWILLVTPTVVLVKVRAVGVSVIAAAPEPKLA